MTNHTTPHGYPASETRQASAHLPRLGPVEYYRIARLTTFEKNPRRYPEKQIMKLMALISQFGFLLPVLVDTDGTIIAGDAWIEAARRLNVPGVPVVVARDWSEAEVRTFRAALTELEQMPTELLHLISACIDGSAHSSSKCRNGTDRTRTIRDNRD